MLHLDKDVNYIICEEFDGVRRAKSAVFTNLEGAKKALSNWEDIYNSWLENEEDKAWVKEHNVSKPYLVVISFTKVE